MASSCDFASFLASTNLALSLIKKQDYSIIGSPEKIKNVELKYASNLITHFTVLFVISFIIASIFPILSTLAGIGLFIQGERKKLK